MPNPTINKSWLRVTDLVDNTLTIRIRNNLGMLIQEASIDIDDAEMAIELEVSNQSPGVYYIEIQSSDTSIYKTLIKQ